MSPNNKKYPDLIDKLKLQTSQVHNKGRDLKLIKI